MRVAIVDMEILFPCCAGTHLGRVAASRVKNRKGVEENGAARRPVRFAAASAACQHSGQRVCRSAKRATICRNRDFRQTGRVFIPDEVSAPVADRSCRRVTVLRRRLQKRGELCFYRRAEARERWVCSSSVTRKPTLNSEVS